MIQGGDLLGTGVGHPEGPGFPYKSEIAPSLKFDSPGRLAMANSGPDTNDSHFFITESAFPSFNGKYTIWGQCENVDVVKAIAQVPRDPGDTPVTPVHIQRVAIERVGPTPADAPESRAGRHSRQINPPHTRWSNKIPKELCKMPQRFYVDSLLANVIFAPIARWSMKGIVLLFMFLTVVCVLSLSAPALAHHGSSVYESPS